MMRRRFAAFAGVGALGCAVQLTTLALLTVAGVSPVLATCVAVEAAVLHNFAWHERWTWADRRAAPDGADAPRGPAPMLGRLFRFNLANGVTSLAGSATLIVVLVHGLGLNVIVANLVTIASLSILNFVIADTWVYAVVTLTAVVVMGAPGSAQAATPSPETMAAWDRFVGAAEGRIRRDVQRARGTLPAAVRGSTTPIEGGLINHWTGGLFIRGVTLQEVLDRLAYPGTPPPQEDVVESRVLSRRGNDSWRVYLKIVRRSIVTATYDTEHDVVFTRLSPALAVSRSVATRIAETGGDDRGFLWRLNSYWRYQQLPDGVLVEMESLTLSRGVPALVKPVALPLVSRVARDSVHRTLDAFRRWFEPRPVPSA
jgi:putative flippase GtrA